MSTQSAELALRLTAEQHERFTRAANEDAEERMRRRLRRDSCDDRADVWLELLPSRVSLVLRYIWEDAGMPAPVGEVFAEFRDGAAWLVAQCAEVNRPHCYNRAPRPAFAWVRAGYCSRTLKPRLRLVATSPDRDRCAAYDAPDGATPAPILDGWNCAACKWLPAGLQLAPQPSLNR